MTDVLPEISPDIELHPDMDADDRLAAMEDYFRQVVEKQQRLRQRLEQEQERQEELSARCDRLSRENETLQQSPIYVVEVVDIHTGGSGESEVVIKQTGNNKEVVTTLPDGIEVSPGDRVGVDGSFSIDRVIDDDIEETRVQAMEVDTAPNVSYRDIGGIDDAIQEVRETVQKPITTAEVFDNVGIEPPSGVLLHGPPGTGKTMLAKAVANEADATFISLAGSDLVHKFVGKGSRLVRSLFDLAEQNAPSVIFIDEIDAIASERTSSKSNGTPEVQRTLMQLMAEMDGFSEREGVRVMGATNRFDRLDQAILRPGRFDRTVCIDLPNESAREEIFAVHLRDVSVSADVSISELASQTEGFSGAEIESTVTEAGIHAIRDDREEIEEEDFTEAIEEVASAREREDQTFTGHLGHW